MPTAYDNGLDEDSTAAKVSSISAEMRTFSRPKMMRTFVGFDQFADMTLSNNSQQFQPVLMNVTISWAVLLLKSARISSENIDLWFKAMILRLSMGATKILFKWRQGVESTRINTPLSRRLMRRESETVWATLDEI